MGFFSRGIDLSLRYPIYVTVPTLLQGGCNYLVGNIHQLEVEREDGAVEAKVGLVLSAFAFAFVIYRYLCLRSK